MHFVIDPIKICRNGLYSTLDICDTTERSQKSLFKDREWEFWSKCILKNIILP